MSILSSADPAIMNGNTPSWGVGTWDGRPLTVRGHIGLKIMTGNPVTRSEIPELSGLAASAGEKVSVLVHPEQIASFIEAHPRARYVFHDVGPQFWVVDRHLEVRREAAARQAWWDAVEQNRITDTLLLDQLIELARQDTEPQERSLREIAKRYIQLEFNGIDAPGRAHPESLEADADELALRDAMVIITAYRWMLLEAQGLTVQYRGSDIRPAAAARFGVLTESIQVKAAIALAGIARNGIKLDLQHVRAVEAVLRVRRNAAVAELRGLSPQLFKTCLDSTTGARSIERTSGGTPGIQEQILQAELTRVINDLRLQTGETIVIPGKNGGLSTSHEDWSQYADRHPFIEKWLAVKDAEKHGPFLASLRESPIHATYRCLVRTGRTACSGPNLQQTPQDGVVRHAFVPSPGYFFLGIDYSCNDLRTLAAICLHRYGRSTLADVLKQGIDPHAHTAAMTLGIPLEEFSRWKDDSSIAERHSLAGGEQVVTFAERYKKMRDAAKAINFGVPAGLGAAALVKSARNMFGVHMTLTEARRLRDTLTDVVYPELRIYLADDGLELLAQNLGTSVQKLRETFARGTVPETAVFRIRDVVSGQQFCPWGEPISEEDHDHIWRELSRLCTNPELKSLLAGSRGSEQLAAAALRPCRGHVDGQDPCRSRLLLEPEHAVPGFGGGRCQAGPVAATP